jgi:hypothetical protein
MPNIIDPRSREEKLDQVLHRKKTTHLLIYFQTSSNLLNIVVYLKSTSYTAVEQYTILQNP